MVGISGWLICQGVSIGHALFLCLVGRRPIEYGKYKYGDYTGQLRALEANSRHERAQSGASRVYFEPAKNQRMTIQPLYTLDDLSELLGRSPETIRKDIRRNPAAVPPRLILPHTRMLRWRPDDVAHWLERLVVAPVTAIQGGPR